MSMIRGSNTRPEIKLRKGLWSKGLRYKLKNDLPGRPDLFFPAIKLAVFVDGCFWHGCKEHFQIPSTNTEFWLEKIGKNVERDRQVNLELEKHGWTVLRLWEHELRGNIQECIDIVVEKVSMARSCSQVRKL